nr:MAG: ORF3 [Torque teno polar bear virus 5]
MAGSTVPPKATKDHPHNGYLILPLTTRSATRSH